MTETKSFSLPEEIAEQIERLAAITGLKASTIATRAFIDYLNKPEVKKDLVQSTATPAPTTETVTQ